MKGVWFLAFCCTIVALPSANSQGRKCLVYTNQSRDEAVKIVHKNLDYKRRGQSDRTYDEGVIRYERSDDQLDEMSPIAALRKRLNEPEEHKRRKRSAIGDVAKEPINMDFGDMTDVYNLPLLKKGLNEAKDDPPVRNITCTQHINGTDITVAVPRYLRTLFDVQAFFERLFN